MKTKLSKLEKISCCIVVVSALVYWYDYSLLALAMVFVAVGLILLDAHLYIKSLNK